MKKFLISVLKALGYFGIYLATQFSVTFVYMFFVMIPIAVKYSVGDYNLMDPVIFYQYMDEMIQALLDETMPITILSGLLTIGVVWLIFVCRKKKMTKEICLRKIPGRTAVSVLVMGFGFNLLTGVLFALLPEAWVSSYEETSNIAFAGEFWLVAITVGIMAPLVEEFVFRGLIYTRLRKGMPVAVAAVITALWFGVMHGHPLWIAYAAVNGLVMIWIFERTGSLLASMLFHFGYNLVAVIEMALPVNLPDWTGFVMLGAGAVLSAVSVYGFLKLPKAEVLAEGAEMITTQEFAKAEETAGEAIGQSTDEPTENFK